MRNVRRVHGVREGRGAGGMLVVASGAGQHRTRTGAGYEMGGGRLGVRMGGGHVEHVGRGNGMLVVRMEVLLVVRRRLVRSELVTTR